MNQSLCSDSVQVPYCISEDSKIISVACAEPKSLQWKCPGALLHLWGQQNDLSCLWLTKVQKKICSKTLKQLKENSKIISAACENASPQPTEIIFAVLCKVQLSKCMVFLTSHSLLSFFVSSWNHFAVLFLGQSDRLFPLKWFTLISWNSFTILSEMQ